MLLQALLDDMLLWRPEVSGKFMFGWPCYLVRGKMFAIAYDDETLVLTVLGEESQAALLEEDGSSSFSGGGKTIKGWIRVPVRDERQFAGLQSSIDESLNNARRKAAGTKQDQ